MGSKYTSPSWILFKRFITILKSVQSYFFLQYFFWFIKHPEHLIKKKIIFPCRSSVRDVLGKFYITYIITSSIVSEANQDICCRYQLLSWSNFYQLHVLVLTLRTHIMIFGGIDGKLPAKNSVWKWISCAEGENDEMGIPSYRERSQLNYPRIELVYSIWKIYVTAKNDGFGWRKII